MEMEEIQLTDLIESYMAPTTPGFQTMITAKKEFSEAASYVGEKRPKGKGFQPFKHQKFTHRYLRAYDDLLILSETGTGKSCEVLYFAEYTRRELEKAKTNPLNADEKAAHFKRVIIFVKGQSQESEFMNQLACKCSDGHYAEVEGVKKAKTETAQKTALHNEIKKDGYTVTTYATFANRLNERYTSEDDDKIAEDYSDTIFWIDEAHNLLINPDTGKKRPKQETYDSIWRVLHLAKRSKRILSTATPMINDVNEVGSLLNLILPLDGVLPPDYDYQTAPENDIRVLFPGLPLDHRTASPEEMAPYFKGQFPIGYDFETATLDDLEPIMRGRIGFVRANDTGAIPEEQGIDFNETREIKDIKYKSQLKIYGTDMSDHQTEGYNKSMEQKGASGKNKSDWFGGQRQAADFVFPDGYWGNEPSDKEGKQKAGFKKYISMDGDSFSATKYFLPWLKDLDKIRTLSCKYAEIIRLVKEEPGNCFVYGEFVVGSGVVTLAVCLEHMGFTRYNESNSMFVGIGTDIVKPLCSGGEKGIETKRIRTDIRKKLRYAILTTDTSQRQFESMMEAMNSYENRHGDYIKVLISSRVGRDGINVNNVVQIHLIGAEWNQSAMYQALSRGIRATSHEDILNEEKQKAIERGEDPDDVRIPVKIYKHAAFTNDSARDSIDLQMYGVSEWKDINIKRIMRIMKQVAVGCQVHYQRNVRDTDIDGSPACDYEKCKYECADPSPDYEDYSTYDVIYSDEILDDVIKDLSEIYKTTNSITLENLFSLLPQFRQKYIIVTLEKLITQKISIIDRFGYPTYLREDSGIFYLDRTYPTGKPSHLMTYYSTGLIGIDEKNLSDVVVDIESFGNKNIMDDIYKIDPFSSEFSQFIDKLSIDMQAKLLEESIIKELEKRDNDFDKAILVKFQKMIIVINEPTEELDKMYEQILQNKPKRGRKPNPDIKKRVKKINVASVNESHILRDSDSEEVYLHILYSQISDNTNYAATARFNKGEGRTRILKPSEINLGWKDVNEIELPIYNAFIQIEIANRNKPFEDKGIYGFILPDGKFRISNKLTEVNLTRDGRRINRGKVCRSWDKLDLIDVMWEIGMAEPETDKTIYSEDDRQYLIEKLIKTVSSNQTETWALDKLSFYHKWGSDRSIKRINMCDYILEHMDKTGRLVK